jgi:hypothetical protein
VTVHGPFGEFRQFSGVRDVIRCARRRHER